MPTKSKRSKLILDDLDSKRLQNLSRSLTAPFREVQRAQILLKYVENTEISQIHKELNTSRPTIYKCIDKALASGVEAGLKDFYHCPKEPVIGDDAKMWIVNLACTKPKEHDYASEMWTYSLLTNHVRKHGPNGGYPYLKSIVRSTIYNILKEHPIQPHKIDYYLEKRDPEFEPKMREVLLVYKDVELVNNNLDKTTLKTITVSVDEKPGVQAIKNIAADLPPTPTGQHPCVSRDYEYKRLGTLSILASLDLHTGRVIAQIHDRHRSREFILLLKELDEYYPKDCQIRIILDNHSSHISKETRRYLGSCPNRFTYVHTPKHGSWLNLVETLFSKMARTFLKAIRVDSKNELKKRIIKGIEEINLNPVVHRWRKFDLLKNV